MAILFAGTSIADAAIVLGATTYTTSGNLAPNVLEGINCSGVGTTTPEFSPASDFWYSEYLYTSISSGSGASMLLFNGPAAATRVRVVVGIGSPRGQVSIQVWRAGAWVTLATSTLEISGNSVFRWDFHFKLHATNGLVELYVNGALFLSFAGNTAPSDGVMIYSVSYGIRIAGVNSVHSASIVATDDTRKYSFVQRMPNGNGAKQEWNGNYLDIDETGISDTDYISTDTANDVSTFSFADIPAGMSTQSVAALVISARLRNAGAISQVNGVARVSSVDYDKTGEFATSAVFGPQNWVFLVNPATGQAWQGADINSAEFGVKAV